MMRIGIVGAGLIGRKRAEAIRKTDPNSQIDAIYDIDQERARQLAALTDSAACRNLDDIVMNGNIDAVVVATPNRFLLDISLKALENGRHVLCEKPLGRNAEEAKKIFLKAREKKRILKTGFNHRHHPAIRKAKWLADQDTLGPIKYIRCVYGHGGRPGYEKEWRASRELCGGGELLDQGVHVVDLFRWFLGEFKEAYGHIGTYFWNMKVEDNAFAIFRTDRGQIAVMHTSWTQWKNKFSFETYGEKGYLIVDGLGGSYGLERLVIGKRKKDASGYLAGAPDEETLEFPGPDISWDEEWKEFSSAVKENREPLGSGYDGLMANRMIEAVYKAAKSNKPTAIKRQVP